jgi:hypothetical protein
MDDNTGALVEHLWQERPIQPDRRKKVLIERAMPLAIVECREAAAGSRRAANDMDDNIDTAELLQCSLRDSSTALRSCDIGGHELLIRHELIGRRACRVEDGRASFT